MKFNTCLSEISEIVMGQSPKGDEVNSSGKGVPLLNGPTEFTARYPDPVQFTEHGRRFAEKGDILFCVRGSTTGRMNYADQKYAIGRGIGAVRGKNGFPTPYVRAVIEQNLDRLLQAATGSTFPNISRDTLNNFEVSSVEQAVANRINQFIVSLEDKVYLNSQTNQTLEQMAQAIFKSWFVDFEPVKAKIAALETGGSEEDALLAAMQIIAGDTQGCANPSEGSAPGAATGGKLARLQAEQPEQYAALCATADLFPSAMQDSELGAIPEGWEATKFGEVSNCLDKHRIPLSKAQREKIKGSIPYHGATSIMDYVDVHLFDGIYLLLGEDGSVHKEDGTPFTQYIWGKVWVNNHAHVLQGSNGISTEQLMLFIKNQNITPYVTGAVQLKLNQKNMNSIPFIKADNRISSAFKRLITPMFSELRNRHDESLTLEKTRDALLPKLLSGAIGTGVLE